jgi:hypothetical protein
MKCSQCNSSHVEKRGERMWCAECRGYVDVFDETAAPQSSFTYRFAKPPEASASADSAAAPPSSTAQALPLGMTNCPACARPISTEAASCPGCGHPFREPLSPYAASATVVIHAIVLCVVGWIISVVLLLIYDSMVANALRTGH